jgi:hypothetical protein
MMRNLSMTGAMRDLHQLHRLLQRDRHLLGERLTGRAAVERDQAVHFFLREGFLVQLHVHRLECGPGQFFLHGLGKLMRCVVHEALQPRRRGFAVQR